MRFALLIYTVETEEAKIPEQDRGELMGAWFGYTEELRNSGKMLGGEALMPTQTAHTVIHSGSDRTIVDGPFAETKEQLGGFYLLEADSWEEASEWAKKMPLSLKAGSVEIRPLIDFNP